MKNQYSGDTLVKEVDTAAKLVDHVNALSNAMGWNFSAVKDMFAWIGPVLAALQGNPICDADPSCSATRGAVSSSWSVRAIKRTSTRSMSWPHQLQAFPDKQTPERVDGPPARLQSRSSPGVLHSMGMDQPGGLQASLTSLQDGANRFAGGSRQVADAVAQLVDQVKQLGAGLSEAAAFLLSLKHDAAQPAMAGFNIPAAAAASRGVQEGRQGIHFAGRPLGAVLGSNQTQSVQHRGDGSGQRDQ